MYTVYTHTIVYRVMCYLYIIIVTSKVSQRASNKFELISAVRTEEKLPVPDYFVNIFLSQFIFIFILLILQKVSKARLLLITRYPSIIIMHITLIFNALK